jgi:hypothetical protein
MMDFMSVLLGMADLDVRAAFRARGCAQIVLPYKDRQTRCKGFVWQILRFAFVPKIVRFSYCQSALVGLYQADREPRGYAREDSL